MDTRFKRFLSTLAWLMLSLLAASPGIMAAGSPEGAASPVTDGRLDLDAFDLAEPMKLDGTWGFYPGFLGLPEGPAPRTMMVPSSWSGPEFEQGLWGAATYTLDIRASRPPEDLALKVPMLGSAFRIYWNGTMVAGVGKPSTLREDFVDGWRPQVVNLPWTHTENRLVIQVANWEDLNSGLVNSLRLGSAPQLQALRLRNIVFDLLIFGALVFMAIYHFGLFWYRRQDRAPLWFGLLALVLGFRPLFYGEIVLLDLFPDFPFPVLFRLGYLTFSLALASFVAFLNSLYPGKHLGIANKVTLGVAGAYSLLLVLGPVRLITGLLPWFQVYTLLAGVVSLGVIIRAIIKHQEGSGLLIMGFLAFFAATVLDIITNMLRMSSFQLVPAGLLFFMLFQSLIIAKKFSMAFAASEEYSLHLQSLNSSLERFIPREVLSFLKKKSIVDISIGDHTEARMTVLFADIRDFTALSETMSPGENFRFINSYLQRVGPLIRKNQGFVDKYMGDGIMALFPGAPDHALQAAVDIREALVAYNEHRMKSGYQAIRIGMGIHHGHLMLGTVGEHRRMDSTVISDAVNMAARLESLTKLLRKDILLSRETMDALEEPSRFPLQHCGWETVKGKSQAVEVFEVLEAPAKVPAGD